MQPFPWPIGPLLGKVRTGWSSQTMAVNIWGSLLDSRRPGFLKRGDGCLRHFSHNVLPCVVAKEEKEAVADEQDGRMYATTFRAQAFAYYVNMSFLNEGGKNIRVRQGWLVDELAVLYMFC